MEKLSTVDEYIRGFPENVRAILERLRATILEEIPEATEAIGYDMPSFNLNGKYIVYFAGWKKHVSLYPLPSGDEGLRREMAQYKTSKGTIRFPLAKPIPYALVGRIVARLAAERVRKGSRV